MTVWKFTLDCGAMTPYSLEIPIGARFLKFANQGGKSVIWYEVRQGRDTEPRWFFLLETGKDLPEELVVYRGTAQWKAAGIFNYVLHLYELPTHG